jgi:hypothetical protein
MVGVRNAMPGLKGRAIAGAHDLREARQITGVLSIPFIEVLHGVQHRLANLDERW